MTIRIDQATAETLDRLARETGRSRSEVVREALRRQLSVSRFDALRRRVAPLAEARGWLTDEDVLDAVS